MKTHPTKTLVTGILIPACAVLAETMPLEWNTTYRTDVPYEFDITPSKVDAASFTVQADGQALPTTLLPGKLPGAVTVRFTVPKGTKSLTCETSQEVRPMADVATIDNLFAGALDQQNLAKWKLPKGVTLRKDAEGLHFAADASADANAVASYDIPVPEGLAGAPVFQDVALTSHAKLAWGGRLFVAQYDAAGKLLPESLCDHRWTTHMRPPEKYTSYRDEGHIHPQARTLSFRLGLHRLSTKFDDYGYEVKDPSILLPSVTLSRLAVRTAEQLPFPKWNDAFFGPGVSGAPHDTAMRFGDANEKAMFYQTHSRGNWTQSVQLREERDLYFPAGAGTVEAWFKPDWKAVAATRQSKGWGEKAFISLFEAYGGFSANTWKNSVWKKTVTRCVALDYHPGKKQWKMTFCDYKQHAFEKVLKKGPELKDGEWTHVALQWMPGGTATLFVNGVACAELPIKTFEAVPLKDPSLEAVSDVWAMEFYLGSRCASLRQSSSVQEDAPLFEGWVDNLRVSTGCRYAAQPFTPARSFAVDSETRALFTFDRTFDGVSGGGFAFIPACVRAFEDRVAHTLALGTRTIQYYPKDLLPENDPAKVLQINNYPEMPKDEEFRTATALQTKSFTLKAGEVAKFSCGETVYPAFVKIANTSATEPLRYPILLQKNGLDPRSFGDLSETLLAQRLSDRENVNKVFQYALSASDYFMSHQVDAAPGTDQIHQATYDALTMLNSYCGFECGPLNNMTANMLTTVAQCPAAQTGGYGHSFQEVFFDGKNHIYDLSAQTFFPAMDNETSAYLKEVGDQPGIHHRMNRSPGHFMRKATRNGGAQDPSYMEKCALVLNPGETLMLSYVNDGRMNNIQMYNHRGYAEMVTLAPDNYDYADVTGLKSTKTWVLRRDRVFPHYSTAVISFDGKPSAASPAVTVAGDSFTYCVRSCYPIVWGEYAATRTDGSKVPLEISTDRGATFRALPDGGDGVYALEYKVKARHEYLIRVKAPLASIARFSARTEGEVNPRTYPGWPQAGENELTFKSEPGPAADVVVGWRVPAKELAVSPTAKTGGIPGFTRELVLVDPARPLTLAVTGASAAAKVVTRGRIKATLTGGTLTVAYDPTQKPGIVHGDDNPETIDEFPTFASVDLVDGAAQKSVTVIVSPQARLVYAADTATPANKSFTFDPLPKGDYLVFMLARFESQPKAVGSGSVYLVDPSNPKNTYKIARQWNGNHNYLKAQMGTTGQRANWKWDTANMEREWRQSEYNGFSFRAFAFPEGTSKLDFTAKMVGNRPIETAAVLVLPLCGIDARRDLRTILFGFNSDPFHLP